MEPFDLFLMNFCFDFKEAEVILGTRRNYRWCALHINNFDSSVLISDTSIELHPTQAS